MNKTFTALAAVAIAATSLHVIKARTAISPISASQVSSSPSIPESLRHSKAASIINPNNHVTVDDTRSITINVPAHVSDEYILARFVRGFFGGHVFAPEGSILRAVGRELTGFELLKDTPVSSHIWDLSQLKVDAVPPLNSVLSGVFRVVDRDIHTNPSEQQEPSYVDFAFGSDRGSLAGVHRFSVMCAKGTENVADTRSVTIEFAHMGCNPQVNERLKPEVLQSLHLAYAMWLFREGVAEVLKA